MDTTLCDISAFQYYRIPPCLLRRMVEEIDLSTKGGRKKLADANSFLGYIETPLHVLETDRARRFTARGMVKHLWSGELPLGAKREIDVYHYVTSPAMTLLMLARHLDKTCLTMAIYEMVGTFSVIRMLPGDRAYVQQCIDAGQVAFEGGWEPAARRGSSGSSRRRSTGRGGRRRIWGEAAAPGNGRTPLFVTR